MKKIYSIILVLTIISLSACSHFSKNDAANAMIIKPSEFSKETEEVLKLFDNEIFFLDYKVDETAVSQSINLWIYKDGEWVEAGATFGEIKFLENRIAIQITDDNYNLYMIDENGHSKYGFPVQTDFSVSTAFISSQLSDPTNIELNKEIPLFVKLGTDKNAIRTTSTDFRNSDCNAGVAITITLTDKELN